MDAKPVLAVIGGTGKEGRGLAYRWARAGYPVLVGSRSPQRAHDAAQVIRDRLGPDAQVEGRGNLQAAREADIVVLAVPYAAHRATAQALREAVQGKIVVDVTVPLQPPKVTRVHLPPEGSAALEAQAIFGPEVQVVDAFQNISHHVLWSDATPEMDVLVAGRGKAARQTVMRLVEDAGFRAWDAGPIENTIVVEGLTSVLLYINKRYGGPHAGVRIVGVAQD